MRNGPGGDGYTLRELAQVLGVDEQEAAEILDEHGYPVPTGPEQLPLSAEDIQELLTAAPLVPDQEGG